MTTNGVYRVGCLPSTNVTSYTQFVHVVWALGTTLMYASGMHHVSIGHTCVGLHPIQMHHWTDETMKLCLIHWTLMMMLLV